MSNSIRVIICIHSYLAYAVYVHLVRQRILDVVLMGHKPIVISRVPFHLVQNASVVTYKAN